MSKHLTTLIAFIALCLGIASAQTKNYVLNIGEFKEFTVSADINVIYKHSIDSAGYAVYDCPPQYTHAITFTNNKGKIKIEVISDNPIPGPLPTITIYSSTLVKATNLGDSTVCIQSTNPSEKLGLKVMGNGKLHANNVYTTKLSATVEAGSGKIYVTGRTQEAKFNVAGAGVINADALKAVKAKAWMLGTGSIECSVSENLSVYGAGSGTVYYHGEPKIKKRNVGVKLVQIK